MSAETFSKLCLLVSMLMFVISAFKDYDNGRVDKATFSLLFVIVLPLFYILLWVMF